MAKRKIPCLLCQAELQKDQAQFVDETTFSFYPKLPSGIEMGIYCPTCFDQKVRSALDVYNKTMDQAKNVNVFFLSQSKESRFVRRIEKPISVDNCLDRDEVVLRLAFLAAQADKNSLVDVDLSSTKVHNGRWQSSLWSGQAIPAHIDEEALKRRFANNPN